MQKKKVNNRYQIIIEKIFYILWGVSVYIGFMESFSYRGYLLNNLKINSEIFYVTFLFIGVVYVLLKNKRKSFLLDKRLNKYWILCLVTIFFYIVLKLLDRFIYPNFVFSVIHIQPNNLIFPLGILLYPALLRALQEFVFGKTSRVNNIFTVMLIMYFCFNLYKIYKIENRSIKYIINNPTASYDEKMAYKVGDVFYTFTKFINKYTPSDSHILMPPQAFPWPQSGNGAFLRYFIYPRKVGNGDEKTSPSKETLSKIDYILLDWGETESTQSPYTHGWPKFDVFAEKIIFMNKDGSFGGEVKEDYNYKDYEGKEVWGIIVVKH